LIHYAPFYNIVKEFKSLLQVREKVGEIEGVNLRVERVGTAKRFQCFQPSKRGGKRGDFLLEGAQRPLFGSLSPSFLCEVI